MPRDIIIWSFGLCQLRHVELIARFYLLWDCIFYPSQTLDVPVVEAHC